MKLKSVVSVSFSLAAILSPANAGGDTNSPSIHHLTDGSETRQPPPTATFGPGEVLDTTTYRQGGRDIIVQQLALDPLRPVVAAVSNRHAETDQASPTTSEGTAEESGDHVPLRLLHISATVYPGPLSHIRWMEAGGEGAAVERSGWSNVDFRHLSGFSTFKATDGTQYGLIMGIGHMEDAPENPPAFDGEAPTFLPDTQNLSPEALAPIRGLHELYAAEGPRLKAAHEGRERARLAREAELLANPPQPKDLIIRYRVAETPVEGKR